MTALAQDWLFVEDPRVRARKRRRGELARVFAALAVALALIALASAMTFSARDLAIGTGLGLILGLPLAGRTKGDEGQVEVEEAPSWKRWVAGPVLALAFLLKHVLESLRFLFDFVGGEAAVLCGIVVASLYALGCLRRAMRIREDDTRWKMRDDVYRKGSLESEMKVRTQLEPRPERLPVSPMQVVVGRVN